MDNTIELTPAARREEAGSLRLIESACLAVFLPIALVASLGRWRWQPWPPGPDGYGSALDEARSMASMVAGIVCSV